MKELVTAAQMAAIERASASQGVSTHALMDRAGVALAEEAVRLASKSGKFLVLCGRGNNGGDGIVAARHLLKLGRYVHCELLPGDDAKLPAEAAAALKSAGFAPAPLPPGVVVGEGDVVVDALLGTGLSRAPQGDYAEAIERIRRWRASGAKVVAADVPSGLRVDTGTGFEPCVKADATLTFGHLKVGLAMEPGATLAGEVRVADIGLPSEASSPAAPRTFLLEEADAVGRIPRRQADTHKGTFGHVLVVAGSVGKSGAAALAAKAVLRSGAGLVTVATRARALPEILAHAPEVMGEPLRGRAPLGLGDLDPLLAAAEGKDAVVIGPGIPRGDETAKLLRALFERLEIPFVVDADALNAIGSERSLLAKTRAPIVVTPHPGEMARLMGIATAEVQRDRLGVARKLAAETGVTVVLKGARTVIAHEDGTAWINPTGNAGMATGGMGDVLGGLIGALLAQGLTTVDAALAGVFAHGLAGDLAVSRTGQMGLIASDVTASLGEVWARWGR